MQQVARAKAKIIEEKRQLALKKHSRNLKESWVRPEKTPSISPESRAMIMRRHGNTKTPAFDHSELDIYLLERGDRNRRRGAGDRFDTADRSQKAAIS